MSNLDEEGQGGASEEGGMAGGTEDEGGMGGGRAAGRRTDEGGWAAAASPARTPARRPERRMSRSARKSIVTDCY